MTTTNIMVEVAPGELIDKITILQIKNERIQDATKLANVRRELDVLTTARDQAVDNSAQLANLAAQLKKTNEKLWDIEDDIRRCEAGQDFGDTFIQLARSVYFTNDIRADLKKQINLLLGSTIVEEKDYVDYQSAEA